MLKFRAAGRLYLFSILVLLTGIYIESLAAPVNTLAQSSESTPARALANLIPKPASVVPAEGTFTVNSGTRIVLDQMELAPVGELLADWLNPAFGATLEITLAPPEPVNMIILSLVSSAELGDEGYKLTVTPEYVKIEAHTPAGAFYGVQTLRQLLPSALTGESGEIAAAVITDTPRFGYRGAMLDVARHFFPVADVKRVIYLMATYKLNRLHLHLSDDQGWRIEIKSWPNLTAIGGQTEVGGTDGGFYTQADYAEIVAYAAANFIEIVPEIDLPGHTNAALASYPELNCNGQAPELYTGTEVGFSSLCIEDELTYTFIGDVIGELAALTPGEFIHIGGDEAKSTPLGDYVRFMEIVQGIAATHGKRAIGWEEMAQSTLAPGSVVQHWFSDFARDAVDQGAKVILSPASKAYLDMKYDDSSPLGLSWAGLSSVQDSYEWDPATQVDGVGEFDILGVEAPLWSETILTVDDIEFMMFPRLMGIAEIAWSPAAGRSWDEYKTRLVTHGARLDAMGVNFFRDPALDWE